MSIGKTRLHAEFHAHYFYASGTPASNNRLVSTMSDPEQYQEFAEECRRLAAVAETDEQRKVLLEMAATWELLAKRSKPAS